MRAIHPEAIIAEKNNAAIEEILKAKRDGLAENQFTSDLKIVTGANGALMQQIMQGIQQQQRTRSPVGASQSKSNHLLRNTFSQEVYDEFLAYKKEMKNQKHEKRIIRHHQQVAKEKLQEVAYKKASISPKFFKKQNFSTKMEILKENRREKDKLETILRKLKMKLKQIDMFDYNFFAKLEGDSKEQ